MLIPFGSLRFRLTVFFGALVPAVALCVSLLVGHFASGYMTSTSGEGLRTIGNSIVSTLKSSLEERTREIELLAGSPLLVSGDWQDPALRQTMNEITRTYRPYAWLGLADLKGTVEVAAEGMREGADVSSRSWFATGRERVFIGDVHEDVELATLLQPDSEEPMRFVDFAAPVRNRDGQLRGVVATHLHWSWINSVVTAALPEAARERGVQVFVRDPDGNVLYPYNRVGELLIGNELLPEPGTTALMRWPDEVMWLTTAVPVVSPTPGDLAWQVVLRQPVESALAAVNELQRILLWLAVPVTLLSMLLAAVLAGRFSQPVRELAAVARRIDEGDETADFPDRSDIDEVRRLATSLRGMTSTLMRRRTELVKTNLWLEQKVVARTAELQEANRQLEALAVTDPLTGLANRRRFDDTLHAEWAREGRAGSSLAILLLDIDYFKQYNDTLGHQAGDECLRQVAAVLQAKVRRAGELVARYGGEEFVVVAGETNLEQARMLAEIIRAGIEEEAIPHPGNPVGVVTVSVGVAAGVPSRTGQGEDFVAKADEALYRAKQAGRNCVIETAC